MTIKELLDGIEFGWLTDLKVAEIKTITHKAEEITAGDGYICLHTICANPSKKKECLTFSKVCISPKKSK